jgi:hypothetical protein
MNRLATSVHIIAYLHAKTIKIYIYYGYCCFYIYVVPMTAIAWRISPGIGAQCMGRFFYWLARHRRDDSTGCCASYCCSSRVVELVLARFYKWHWLRHDLHYRRCCIAPISQWPRATLLLHCTKSRRPFLLEWTTQQLLEEEAVMEEPGGGNRLGSGCDCAPKRCESWPPKVSVPVETTDH